MRTIPRRSVALAAVAFVAQTALGQQGGAIEEIVITAQKRQENLSDVPIAITTFSNQVLLDRGITTLAGIAETVPSITAQPYPSSSNTLIMSMRGQGSANPMEITQDGAVGLYVDGFYIARPQSSTFDIADVERIEVLRGPQGTLYGRNTTGGAVNIISRKPSGEFGFRQELTSGSFNQFRSLTVVDTPAVAGVSAKLSYLRSDKDGFVKNPGASNDFNEEHQRAVRAALHWQPTDAVSVDYVYEEGEIDSTPVYYQSPSLIGQVTAADGTPYFAKDHRMKTSYRAVDLPLSTSEYDGHYLTATWDVSPLLTLKSLTGYRELESYIYQDYVEAFFVPYTTEDWITNRQFSQELQFVGSALDGALNYITGLYYFRESGHHREIIAAAMDRYVEAEAVSQAVFGQLTWTPGILQQRLDITVGARYTRDAKKAERDFTLIDGTVLPQAVTRNDDDYNQFNPALTLSYRISDDLNVYGKWVTGYRAGGSGEAAALDSFGVTFGPEDVTSYELGLKSHWWNRRVRLNVAAFRAELEDMQMAFTATADDPSFTQTYNAGKAVIQGVEVDLLFAPINDLAFSLDYSFMDAEVKQVDVIANTMFSEPGSPYRDADNISDLFRVPLTPRHSASVAVDWTFYRFVAGDLRLHVNYDWRDEFYGTTTTGKAVPNADLWISQARGLLNARLSARFELPRGDWLEVALWGKNIADSDYEFFITTLGSPLTGYSNQAIAWNEPSTYGIDLIYEY